MKRRELVKIGVGLGLAGAVSSTPDTQCTVSQENSTPTRGRNPVMIRANIEAAMSQ